MNEVRIGIGTMTTDGQDQGQSWRYEWGQRGIKVSTGVRVRIGIRIRVRVGVKIVVLVTSALSPIAIQAPPM
jgi:hypothetical protein